MSASGQELLHHPGLMPLIAAGEPALGKARAGDVSELQWSAPTACSEALAGDLPAFPTTLFLVDADEVAEAYVNIGSRMPAITLPLPVSNRGCRAGLGVPCGTLNALPGTAGLGAYQWDGLRRRMHRQETQQTC